MTLLLLLVLIVGPFKPDPALTPGVVRPLTTATICATRWGHDRRAVTHAMRRDVFARYRIPYEKHHFFEVDHLIPRELGGADDVLNLWPELWADAHTKDRIENALHRAVCAGTVDLVVAQTQMRRWGR